MRNVIQVWIEGERRKPNEQNVNTATHFLPSNGNIWRGNTKVAF